MQQQDQEQPAEQAWITGQAQLIDDQEPAVDAHQVVEEESECDEPVQRITRGMTIQNKKSISEQGESAEQVQASPIEPTAIPLSPQSQPEQLPVQGDGENAFIKFQLIPISETPGKAAVGEVVERKLRENQVMKLGRQVIKDGQATIKGNKKATELDVWFSSKVVSRLHAEIWTKDGQLCVKDVGSSSGTFLNGMRLSPTSKESRPYPLKQGDVLQFGVDFKGKADSDVYRAIVMKLGFHDQAWLVAQRANANPQRFSAALKQLLAATNPYATNQDQSTEGETDCCICIGAIAPFQALFIAPCSHCYHYKCVGYLISQSPMFQCPMCRQVANLTASVSSEDLTSENKVTAPLPILAVELEEKEKEQPTLQRKDSNVRQKRPSLVDRLGLGILKSSHAPTPATPEEEPQQQPAEEPNPRLQKKRTFSMKLKSFVSGKSNQEQESSVPRSQHPVPGEQPQQDQQNEENGQQEQKADGDSVQPGH